MRGKLLGGCRPFVLSSVRGYQRSWVSGDLVAGVTLLTIAVPEQLATSRLAGMPPITGFYAFIAGSLLFALLGSNPHVSVGADSTIAPLFAVGVAHFAAAGSPRYVELVAVLAVLVGVIVALVWLLRLGWIAEFLSAPIITGFLAGVAVLIVVHQLPDLLGLPPTGGSTVHRIRFILGHLGDTNGWTLLIGLGVLAIVVVVRADRPQDPGGAVGADRVADRGSGVRSALRPRCRGPRPGRSRAPALRIDRPIAFGDQEPRDARRGGGARGGDAVGGHQPRVRRTARPLAGRGTGPARCRRGQHRRGPGGRLPGQRQPAENGSDCRRRPAERRRARLARPWR